jgi:signal transduction histidine kinase
MYLDNELVNIIKSLVVFSLLVGLYTGRLKHRIASAVFIYIAAFTSDFITAYSITFVTDTPIGDIIVGTPEFLYGLLVSKSLLVIISRMLLSIMKRRKFPKFATFNWFSLVIPPIGSIFVLYNFLYLRAHNIADILLSFIVVVTNFIVIIVYDTILTNYEVQINNELLEEQIKHYSYQSYLAESSNKFLLKTKHDLSNLLIGIKVDITENRLKNAEKRISEFLGEINALDGPAQSGNLIIDSIINFKYSTAQYQHIYFSLELNIPRNLTLDSVSVCQIIGNALDNAIEATRKIENIAKRIIQIHMSYVQESLFLQIINPYEGDIIIDNRGCFLSAKKGYQVEGIGVQSIKSAVSKEQGVFDISYDNGEFRLSIVLYSVSTSGRT